MSDLFRYCSIIEAPKNLLEGLHSHHLALFKTVEVEQRDHDVLFILRIFESFLEKAKLTQYLTLSLATPHKELTSLTKIIFLRSSSQFDG